MLASGSPRQGGGKGAAISVPLLECALCVSAVNRLVKLWCAEEGLHGNFGSHTLRKTWGYHQRIANQAPTPLLMIAFGHKTQSQTLAYLHIQETEVAELYTGMEL